jgi:ABC-type uncharacterized transport system fused permease/ATPase subunit
LFGAAALWTPPRKPVQRFVDLLICFPASQEASVRLSRRCKVEDSTIVGVAGVHLVTPEGSPLYRNLSFTVPRGESLLIMGPSGCGKSSLLRVLAGLWPTDEGIVYRPSVVGRDGLFFVPQRPYIPQGSLRSQVVYPDTPNSQTCSDEALAVCSWWAPVRCLLAARVDSQLHLGVSCSFLQEILEAVGLGYLLQRTDGFDAAEEWADSLSLGEQQRLGNRRLEPVLHHHTPVTAVILLICCSLCKAVLPQSVVCDHG